MTAPLRHHQRVTRTRQSICKAFTELIMERRFDQVSIGDIVKRANVGRSTFYLYFKSRNDVLKCVMDPILRDLASLAGDEFEPARMRGLINHFWQNRRLSSAVFASATTAHVRRTLATYTEQAIRAALAGTGSAGNAPRLRAMHLAAGEISLLHAWLSGEVVAEPDESVACLRDLAGPRLVPDLSVLPT